MPSPEMRKNLASITIFTLPVIVVKLATMVLGGPASTSAQDPGLELVAGDGTPVPTNKVAAWSEDQLAAARYIDALRSQPFGATPLLHDTQEPELVPDPEIIPVEPVSDVKFVLQAVMSGERGDTALINGRPYRKGDQIRGTRWSVISIDSSNHIATLKEAKSGQSMVIRVELPRSLLETLTED